MCKGVKGTAEVHLPGASMEDIEGGGLAKELAEQIRLNTERLLALVCGSPGGEEQVSEVESLGVDLISQIREDQAAIVKAGILGDPLTRDLQTY